VEAALVWRVVEPLTVGISAGYLDAKYKDFKQVGSQVLADFDRSGAQMPNAPKWQLSFNANLDQPLNDKLRLVSTLLVSHTSEVLYLASALPGTLPDAVAPGYWLANLRIGLRTRDDKYGFAVVADNLFNKAYYTYGNSTSLGNSLGWGSPRIIRGEIIARF
jgi:iron complex outermembrane receptor protein